MNKILIAKNNPKNKCYGEEGEELLVVPFIGNNESKECSFIGAQSGKPSQYGWIKEVEDYDLTEKVLFIASKFGYDEKESFWVMEAYKSIQKIPSQKPVACGWSEEGFLNEKKKVFKVHRVFFYKDKEE